MVRFILCWLAALFVAAQAKTAQDYFVTHLPGQPEGELLRQYAGHIEVNAQTGGHMWFWKFENRHLANRHRTVLWLNGGPGCSSLDGALMEIGPYRLSDENTLTYNNGSWDEFANVVFVDNPVGTGYSYVNTDSYLSELNEMADQMIVFLEKYFELFPGESWNDLYIAGESYAGQHIPYIAQAILDRNSKKPNDKWNLEGLLIGNGWISAPEQGPAYLEMAYKAGLVQKGTPAAARAEKQLEICKGDMEQAKGNPKVQYSSCESVLVQVIAATHKNGRCVNMYDVRLDDTQPDCGMNWPPDLAYLNPYLNKKEVRDALHVDAAKQTGWVECNGQVSRHFTAAKSAPSIQLLPGLIEAGVQITLFSGDQDLICNHLGTEAMINNMEWSGGKGFETAPGTWAPRRDWSFEGEPAGIYQSARNLTYVLFYNSSHMVPFDYPRRARDMLDRAMGVDIANIGGQPGDSRLDGEKLPDTSVGGHPNSTAAAQDTAQKIDKAKWSAYYRSGAIALVVVSFLAAFFGWYVWQDRRRRAGYAGIYGGSSSRLMGEGSILRRDVEQADFDENELDDLTEPKMREHDMGANRYSLGDVSDESDDESQMKPISRANGA